MCTTHPNKLLSLMVANPCAFGFLGTTTTQAIIHHSSSIIPPPPKHIPFKKPLFLGFRV